MGEDRNLNAPHMDRFARIYEVVREQYLKGGKHCLIYNGNIFSPLDYKQLQDICHTED